VVKSAVTELPPLAVNRADRLAHAAAPARGVHRWFAKVIDEDGPGIMRLLWRLLGNEQDVLDAYQESWCLLAQLGHPRDVRSVKAYVYRTASNVAIEMIRRRRRRRGHWTAVVEHYERQKGDEAGDEDDEADSAAVAAMREMMSELPPHLRNVLVLRDLANMSYKEVGKVLGIEPTTARVYRRQAVLKMAELLRGERTS